VKGPRQNRVQQSVQSPQPQTEEKQRNNKQKKQAKIHTLSKLQDSAATIDNRNRR